MDIARISEKQENRVKEVLTQWHERGRADFERSYSNLNYDTYYTKHFHVGGKYIRLDSGTSGMFMADIETGLIYGIKGYGVPDKKKVVGNLWDENWNGADLYRRQTIRGRFDYRMLGGTPLAQASNVA